MAGGLSWVIVDGVLTFAGTTRAPSFLVGTASSGMVASGTNLNFQDNLGNAFLRVIGGGSGPVQVNCPTLQFASGGTAKFNFQLNGSTDANLTAVNGAGTSGVGLDVGTDAVLKVKTRAFADTATIAASAFQTTTALVALGGGSTPTLGTIGATGPATATQNTWLRMVDSTGAAFWVPVWK